MPPMSYFTAATRAYRVKTDTFVLQEGGVELIGNAASRR
jgi:hypothetical protein